MKNLQKDLEPAGEQMTLFSQAGSRNYASPTHQQESEKGKTMNAIYGQRCLERFEKLPLAGSLAKTFSGLLIGTEDWYSRRCKLTWKLKGTKYKRTFFQLVVSMPPTEDIESGLSLIKTPTAMDGIISSGKKNPVSGNSGTLSQEIMSGYKPTMEKLGLLPTPVASDGTTGAIIGKNDTFKETSTGTLRKINQNGVDGSIGLGRMAGFGLLPTPSASDGTRGLNGNQTTVENGRFVRTSETTGTKFGASLGMADATGLLPTPCADDDPHKNTGKRNQDGLQKRAFQTTGKTSQLNPRFVLEMMGFEPTHCDSAFEKIAWELYLKKKSTKSFQKRLQLGQKKQSKQEGTQ